MPANKLLSTHAWMRCLCFFLLTASVCLAQNNPIPHIDLPLNPSHWSTVSGLGLTLTVRGSGFVSGSVVNWNGSPRATTLVSKTVLHVVVLAADVTANGTAAITVTNPAPGGGTSDAVYFPIHEKRTTVALARRDYPQSFATRTFLHASAIGDFNEDGKVDIAVATTGVGIEVFPGDGAGGFAAPVVTASSYAPYQLFVGDFNGDGHLDLLAFQSLSRGPNSSVVIFLGKGDGSFTQQPTLPITGYGLALGDFNGDGKLDLAINTDLFHLQTYSGNGDGTFSGPQLVWAVTRGNVNTPIVGDFNRDGTLDIAICGQAFDAHGRPFEVLNMFRGKGDGTFWKTKSTLLAGVLNNNGVAVADFNHDGKLDIIGDSGIVLLGNGDGTFSTGASLSLLSTSSMQTADMNNDGNQDLVVQDIVPTNNNTYSFGVVSVLLGNGDGTFQNALAWNSEANLLNTIGIADFNGDGLLDVVYPNLSQALLNPFPEVSVFLQTGLSVSPNMFYFGRVKVGTSSAPRTATLTNTTFGNLEIESIKVNAGIVADYSLTTTCGSILPPNNPCTVSVVFTPTKVAQDRNATIRIQYKQFTGPQYIEVKGIGTNN